MRNITLIPAARKNLPCLPDNMVQVQGRKIKLRGGYPRPMLGWSRRIHNWQKLSPEEK